MKKIGLLFLVILFVSCQSDKAKKTDIVDSSPENLPKFTVEQAKKIVELPLHCIETEYPNKLGQVLGSDSDLKSPKKLRPIFYGCFDWHSSVHGYWTVITVLKKFPELDQNNEIRERLNKLITEANCKIEMSFFNDPNNKTFERTYGWAWFFQLHSELTTWNDRDGQRWARILQPMADLLVERYTEYLPKLLYPIRTGTHDNTAFGLSLSLDYARIMGIMDFENLIIENAQRLYANDISCPLNFEPSGHDFLSPCLEEARLMSKVLESKNYKKWLKDFLPELYNTDFSMAVAQVSDRTDGHLVHLDGLNFSRAACLNEISKKAELPYLHDIAKKHFEASFDNITDDDYMGSHWLGTFALYYLVN
ncbi:DUF2891 domain-containing protein [Myroides indicus]|uniref:DUF2891 family protein n=1 Tax=Myroides indicus TaxID=1323422 RepID=A0A4V3E7T1_9FLAO|nr:DUF2891 domain-containing protein [Myroides indicus]TDS54006.1 hypothetical protein C8P70_12642 [Myroides indicus]